MRSLAVMLPLMPLLALVCAAAPAAAPAGAATSAKGGPTATLALGAPTATSATVALAATRVASASEMAAFATSQPLLGAAAVGTPVFAATRAAGARAWTVSASVDGVAARGAGQLCRLRRTRFAYQPQGPAAQRWRSDGVDNYVWIAGARACVVPAQPVAMLQALPDTDVLAAYAQLTPLLQRARLLMAGNSSCAVYRSDNFRLVGMGVSAPPLGVEEMLVLRFESDRGSDAQVWVRRRALELAPWNVACAPR